MMWRSGMAVLAAVLLGGSSPRLDVSVPLALKNAGRCEFRPSGEAVLRAILHPVGEGPELVAASEVRIGRLGVPVQYEKVSEPATGFVTYRSRIEMPAGTTWNGLTLVSLAAEEFVPPEVDGLSSRELLFADSVESVRSQFERLGVRFPLGDSEIFIDKPLGGCEGSIRVEQSGGLTKLRCEWGC
jgi:hypothetical protein